MLAILTALISRFLPHWRIILLALAAVSCLYAGWHARAVVEQARDAEELRAMAERRKKQEEDAYRVSAALESRLAALQEQNRTLTRKVARETNDPAYRCRVPDGGLRLYNEAVSDPRAPEPDRPVPAPGDAR